MKIEIKEQVKKFFVFSVFLIVFFSLSNDKCLASSSSSIFLDKVTINKGYTVNSLDNNLKLSLTPGILEKESRVNIKVIDQVVDSFSLNRLSSVYEFEFLNKEAYDHSRPFYIQLVYNEQDGNYKQVFFFDKNYNSWRPLPTQDFPKQKFVRSLIHLPYARLAVFSYKDVMGQGQASWYAYKHGMYAASPDFPKGSILRVYNLDNDKYVDVIINDFGPDRSIFPNRIIDLDKEAFEEIASLGEGIINVSIKPLYIVKDDTDRVLGLKNEGALIIPEIEASSAIVLDQSSGEVLWEKNSKEILPIASLTKLISAKVFINNNNNLDRIVEYKYQDEEYNYQYCNSWESAKVSLKEGDQVTVRDLLYATLVSSKNNAVESLVRVSGLSRENFVKEMNELAEELGAKNTNFVEPSGLSSKNVSSALDYAIISKEILKDPIIKEISGTKIYSFTTINTNKKYTLRTTNDWLRYDIMPFTASKTGYLHEAGNCLLVETLYNGRELLAVILGAGSRNDSLFASKDIFNFAKTLF